MLGAVGAALLPLFDSSFVSFDELAGPWIVSAVLFLVFLTLYAVVISRTGALPGLGTMGVKAVRVSDGREAGTILVHKYALECIVATLTLFFGFLLVLRLTRDEQGRTWFDRLVGVIYVDTRVPMDDQEHDEGPSSSEDFSGIPQDPQMRLANSQHPVASIPQSHLFGYSKPGLPAVPEAIATTLTHSNVDPGLMRTEQGQPGAMTSGSLRSDSLSQGLALPSQFGTMPQGVPSSAMVSPQPHALENPRDEIFRGNVGGELSVPQHADSVIQLDFADGNSQILEGTLVIGRNPGAEAQRRAAMFYKVDDPRKSVSKTHVVLTARDGSVLVEDLNSTNGTVVITPEGKPVPVRAGQLVAIGDGATVVFGDMRVKVRIR